MGWFDVFVNLQQASELPAKTEAVKTSKLAESMIFKYWFMLNTSLFRYVSTV